MLFWYEPNVKIVRKKKEQDIKNIVFDSCRLLNLSQNFMDPHHPG